MDDKKNDIFNFYEYQCDENNRLNRARINCVEFLTTMKYIQNTILPQSEILDACAGTGVYAFPLAKMGYTVTAGDLVDFNVTQIRNKQEDNPILKKVYTGSILDLSMFKDNSFDVVLNLGAFYHFKYEEDRIKSITESMRVLKPNGIYCLAYLNRYANYLKYNSQMKGNFDIFEEYMNKGYNEENYLFYATTPEDIESFMPSFGLKQIYNIATDGVKFIMSDTVNSFNDNEFERWLNIHYQTCEVKSILGYSEHGLYIGRKAEHI
ncbi:MAG: class I SAM-dependent methyltransferase [Clostridium sp.]|uniref:class I SAM-dependent methyltransferase n=1 Tax=Clostridium sp. TaxID=1506 RepID=UPI003D6D6BAE